MPDVSAQCVRYYDFFGSLHFDTKSKLDKPYFSNCSEGDFHFFKITDIDYKRQQQNFNWVK
jgi:hypothetical protein